jgi:hypothetical protein
VISVQYNTQEFYVLHTLVIFRTFNTDLHYFAINTDINYVAIITSHITNITNFILVYSSVESLTEP